MLGPILFLIYVNDISNHLPSPIRLFANDCVVYRQIAETGDASALQPDINQIAHCSQQWQMEINVSKMKYIKFTRSSIPEPHYYIITNAAIENESTLTYLGIFLLTSRDMESAC